MSQSVAPVTFDQPEELPLEPLSGCLAQLQDLWGSGIQGGTVEDCHQKLSTVGGVVGSDRRSVVATIRRIIEVPSNWRALAEGGGWPTLIPQLLTILKDHDEEAAPVLTEVAKAVADLCAIPEAATLQTEVMRGSKDATPGHFFCTVLVEFDGIATLLNALAGWTPFCNDRDWLPLINYLLQIIASVAVSHPDYRRTILEHLCRRGEGIFDKLLTDDNICGVNTVDNTSAATTRKRFVVRCLRNLSSGAAISGDIHPETLVNTLCLSPLSGLLLDPKQVSEVVLVDAVWTLALLSNDSPGHPCQRLLQQLHSRHKGVSTFCLKVLRDVVAGHQSNAALTQPALAIIGTQATTTNEETQRLLDGGALYILAQLLVGGGWGEDIRQDACWTLSNIAAGSDEQIRALVESGVLPLIWRCLAESEFIKVRKEAMWTLLNIVTEGNWSAEVMEHGNEILSMIRGEVFLVPSGGRGACIDLVEKLIRYVGNVHSYDCDDDCDDDCDEESVTLHCWVRALPTAVDHKSLLVETHAFPIHLVPSDLLERCLGYLAKDDIIWHKDDNAT